MHNDTLSCSGEMFCSFFCFISCSKFVSFWTIKYLALSINRGTLIVKMHIWWSKFVPLMFYTWRQRWHWNITLKKAKSFTTKWLKEILVSTLLKVRGIQCIKDNIRRSATLHCNRDLFQWLLSYNTTNGFWQDIHRMPPYIAIRMI